MEIPFDLLYIIASFYTKPRMKLLDWIPIKKLDWACLSQNPNAIHILEQNLDKVDWTYLSLNPNAIHILELNLDKVDWEYLSTNPNAIHILEQNLDKVVWPNLCFNQSPNAIHLIQQNLNKVPKSYLSRIPNATHLLFSFDYEKMKENNREFFEELVEKVFHPERIMGLSALYEFEFSDYMENII